MSDKNFNIVSRDGTVTIATSDTVTTGTNTLVNLNGLVRQVNFTTANMQDTDSTNFIITNEFGGTLHASGTKAESTTFSTGTVFPVYGTTTIVAVAEGTQSGARAIPYSLIYED